METLKNMISTLWRRDSDMRESLLNSGNVFWTIFAIVVPFGWLVFLFRLEPVRVRVRALRYYGRGGWMN